MRPFRIVVGSFFVSFVFLVLFNPPASAFPDVSDTHRYARAITELAQLGIVSGKGDGTFGPDDPVNRAQFAKMICGLLEIGVSEEDGFRPFVDLGPDDPSDLYPHEFVGAAYRAGITKGRTATTFAPYAEISLAQVVSMVVRAADAYHPGILATPPTDWHGWWADVGPDHGANVRRADYTDLLAFLPIEDTWADLSRPVTRGEVSQILFNLRNALEELNTAVSFEGNALDLISPIYLESNRYYLPLIEIVYKIGGSVSVGARAVKLNANNTTVTIDLTYNYYTVNGRPFTPKRKVVAQHDTLYVSLFDLHKMLDLKVSWDEDSGTIGLYRNRDIIAEDKQPGHGKTALVRFEDVTASQRYSSAESLERLRTIFDYCFAKDIPMQLAWVPRYIDPVNGIDNAPAEDYSMHNANFIYTMDYFADSGGLIGLHGYTHQYGNEVSLTASEFDGKHNTSESSIRERLLWAIDDANRLALPITFFESPHYGALAYQKKIIGEYFDILYEPEVGVCETNVGKMRSGGRVVTWIPTPLGYIEGVGFTNSMIARIEALGADELGSFFYHPYMEFGFMVIGRGLDGYPGCEYSAGSPLHRVVSALLENGYRFVDIDSL